MINILYFEIYNYTIKALSSDQNINNRNKLEFRTDAQKGVILKSDEFKKSHK